MYSMPDLAEAARILFAAIVVREKLARWKTKNK